MTVAELIEELEAYPPDMKVVDCNYEEVEGLEVVSAYIIDDEEVLMLN